MSKKRAAGDVVSKSSYKAALVGLMKSLSSFGKSPVAYHDAAGSLVRHDSGRGFTREDSPRIPAKGGSRTACAAE